MKTTGKCEYKMADGRVCGAPTNQVFPHGTRRYWFCEEHMKPGGAQVIGRPFKDSRKPKA